MSLKELYNESLEHELREAFLELAKKRGEEVEKRCAVIFLPARGARKQGRYIVNFLNKTYSVELERGEVIDLISGKNASKELALIMVRYLAYSTGGGHSDEWVPYEKIPGSKRFLPHFDRLVLRHLARTFGYEPEKYELACKRLGGKKERLGGLSYSFHFLPKVRILTQLWKASKDDYTPPAANISFNHSSRHYLNARDLLLVGQLMVNTLESEVKKTLRRKKSR